MRECQISYDVKQGRFTKEELGVSGRGGCDQILLCSYIQGDDGSGSYLWLSRNGKNADMEWGRKVNCWLMLTKELADNAPSGCPNQKKILAGVFEIFRKAIASRTDNVN